MYCEYVILNLHFPWLYILYVLYGGEGGSYAYGGDQSMTYAGHVHVHVHVYSIILVISDLTIYIFGHYIWSVSAWLVVFWGHEYKSRRHYNWSPSSKRPKCGICIHILSEFFVVSGDISIVDVYLIVWFQCLFFDLYESFQVLFNHTSVNHFGATVDVDIFRCIIECWFGIYIVCVWFRVWLYFNMSNMIIFYISWRGVCQSCDL